MFSCSTTQAIFKPPWPNFSIFPITTVYESKWRLLCWVRFPLALCYNSQLPTKYQEIVQVLLMPMCGLLPDLLGDVKEECYCAWRVPSGATPPSVVYHTYPYTILSYLCHSRALLPRWNWLADHQPGVSVSVWHIGAKNRRHMVLYRKDFSTGRGPHSSLLWKLVRRLWGE